MPLDADGVDLAPALHRLYGAAVPPLTLTKLGAEASTRSYYRIEFAPRAGELPHRSIMAMRLGEDVKRADELSGASEAGEASEQSATKLPFVEVQALLAGRGVPVPAILVDDSGGRVLLLEDLGDETFERRLRKLPQSAWAAQYAQAAELLARMHMACEPRPGERSIAFERVFDRQLLRAELDHFRQWGIEAVHGPLSAQDRSALDGCFDALVDRILELPRGFVHRDYQSRNLMWASDRRPGEPETLTVIDFQDALRGPQVYDLVALLNDSYVVLDAALQRATLDAYARARGFDEHAAQTLRRGFHLVAVQRKLKDAGRFVLIDRVRGNPGFLPHYPQSLRYAGRALHALADSALLELLTRLVPGFSEDASVPPAQTGRADL